MYEFNLTEEEFLEKYKKNKKDVVKEEEISQTIFVKDERAPQNPTEENTILSKSKRTPLTKAD